MLLCNILDTSVVDSLCVQNPDPEAAKYFAEFIAKAHETLTNPEAFERWKRDGHPDGPRVSSNTHRHFIVSHF